MNKFGSWITISSPEIAQIMGLSDFNFLVVDMQHSTITVDIMKQMIANIPIGMEKYVRVNNNSDLISKCLDAGATGIIIANVETGEDIDNIVNASKYPPIGKRSSCLSTAQKYGLSFQKYFKEANNNLKVIVQIESRRGYENFIEIIDNENINGYMIGPYDLSADMGLTKEDVDKGELEKMEKFMINYTQKGGKIIGYHIVHPNKEIIKRKVDLGYNFLVLGVDNVMILDKCLEMEGMI